VSPARVRSPGRTSTGGNACAPITSRAPARRRRSSGSTSRAACPSR
jgi:hypothetical protein